MRVAVEPGRFALLGFPEPPGPADLAALAGAGPAWCLREGGETSLLVAAEGLAAARARHPRAAVEAPLVWIRFELALAWDLVGFLARVTEALARAGVPIGAVSGHSRDSVFVHEAHVGRAKEALRALFSSEAGEARPIG
jgi:hypothetical protein